MSDHEFTPEQGRQYLEDKRDTLVSQIISHDEVLCGLRLHERKAPYSQHRIEAERLMEQVVITARQHDRILQEAIALCDKTNTSEAEQTIKRFAELTIAVRPLLDRRSELLKQSCEALREYNIETLGPDTETDSGESCTDPC